MTITDQAQQLALLKKNVARNRETLECAGCCAPVCRILDWEKAERDAAVAHAAAGLLGDEEEEGGEEEEGRRGALNQRSQEADPAWDRILVADCTYPPEMPGLTGVYEASHE